MIPTQRGGWRRRATLAALGAIGTVLSLTLVTPSASAANEIPGPDEIVTSPNVKHLANVPFQAPLNVPGTVGTDIAFTGKYAIVGNYLGFTIYNISKPSSPKVISNVLCPGGQMDPSVHGDLLFISVDSRRSDDSCSSTAQPDGTKAYWEGMRIFDISDKANPKYIKAIETDCGSHTHTLVPGKNKKNVYLYVQSYGPNPNISKCQPPHDKLSIIKVPVNKPTSAAVVSTPVLFPDGGNPGYGDPGQIEQPYTYPTQGCHDITVYPSKDLAAGACMGDGVLYDIRDRENPKEIHRVQDDAHFAFWHSATFDNDATKVIFTDELGGGVAATCKESIDPKRGADGIYDIVGKGKKRELVFRGYQKIDRPQADSENCVAHNGSLIPVPGKDIMVQSWYMGGVQIWDFTDSANPKEIGFFERGPAANPAESGGSWSAYYYNGYIYSSDIGKGLDVLRINDPRTDPAKKVRTNVLNVQTQQHYDEG